MSTKLGTFQWVIQPNTPKTTPDLPTYNPQPQYPGQTPYTGPPPCRPPRAPTPPARPPPRQRGPAARGRVACCARRYGGGQCQIVLVLTRPRSDHMAPSPYCKHSGGRLTSAAPAMMAAATASTSVPSCT